MGRLRKNPTGRRRETTPASPGPVPNPPRPNRLFLAVAGFLLLVWMALLGVLAAIR